MNGAASDFPPLEKGGRGDLKDDTALAGPATCKLHTRYGNRTIRPSTAAETGPRVRIASTISSRSGTPV